MGLAKIAEICNFWAFWPIIQVINHLFKIRQKALLKEPGFFAKPYSATLITGQNVQKLLILAAFASCIASIVKKISGKSVKEISRIYPV